MTAQFVRPNAVVPAALAPSSGTASESPVGRVDWPAHGERRAAEERERRSHSIRPAGGRERARGGARRARERETEREGNEGARIKRP